MQNDLYYPECMTPVLDELNDLYRGDVGEVDYFINIANRYKKEIVDELMDVASDRNLTDLKIHGLHNTYSFVQYIDANTIHYRARYGVTYVEDGDMCSFAVLVQFLAESHLEVNKNNIQDAVVRTIAVRVCVE